MKASQKIAIMDVLLSMLEFAATYNSYSNLRMRMHHIPVERWETISSCNLFFLSRFFCIGAFDPCIGRMLNTISSFGRPPLNLLRQELAGTSIYLDVLQKTTSGFDAINEKQQESNVDAAQVHNDSSFAGHSSGEEKLEGVAEEKFVSFCEQVLKEASDLQSSVGETTNMDVHRVLELRSPVIVKVWNLSPIRF